MIFSFILTIVVLWLMAKIFMPLLYPRRPTAPGQAPIAAKGHICEFCGGSLGEQTVVIKKRYFCSSQHAQRFFG